MLRIGCGLNWKCFFSCSDSCFYFICGIKWGFGGNFFCVGVEDILKVVVFVCYLLIIDKMVKFLGYGNFFKKLVLVIVKGKKFV